MSEENNNKPKSEAEPTGTDPGHESAESREPAGKQFSEEQVNDIVQKRLDKDRKKYGEQIETLSKTLEQVQAQLKAQPAPKQEQQKPKPMQDSEPNAALAEVMEKQAALEARLAKAEADKAYAETVANLHLTPEQRAELRDLFDPAKPDAFTERVQRLGLGKAPEPAKQETAPPPEENPVPNGKQYQSPGAPAGARTDEVFESDATKWSKDYIDRLREQGTFLEEVEKYKRSLPGGSNSLFRRRIPQVK
jgi:hypothetical protein